MTFIDFFHQFSALAYKNYLLKRRQPIVLIAELAIPILLILALGQLKKVVKLKHIKEFIPTTYMTNSRVEDTLHFVDCWNQNLFWSCNGWCSQWGTPDFYIPPWEVSSCQPNRVAIAPKNPNDAASVAAASQFVKWVNDLYPLTVNFSMFELFSSENSFLNTMESPLYSLDPSLPAYSSALIFDSGYPNWDFRLRLNGTINDPQQSGNSNVKTLGSNIDLTVHSSSNQFSQYNEIYLQSGIFQLMDLGSSFVASQTCLKSSNCSATNPGGLNVHVEGIAGFPNPATSTSGFWSILGSVFGLVMVIALLYPVANVIKSLVQEKETKLREGMLMMSMRAEALWASWIFHFVCLFFPLSILLTLVGKNLFQYSSPFLIFSYFMMFFLASISYCIFISSLFSKSRTASIVGSLLFFAGYFIYAPLSSSKPVRSTFMAACLHPSAAFIFSTLAFAEWEDAGIGVTVNTWDTSNLYPITFRDTLNMMLVDMFYLAALSWYLDQIWPSEFGTQKPWYFLFLPSYWFGCCLSVCTFFGLPVSETRRSDQHQPEQPVGLGPSFPYQLIQRSTFPKEREIEMKGGNRNNNNENEVDPLSVEPVPDSLRSQVENGVCVDIRDLCKEFSLPNGGKKMAVDHLSLTMYSGQITALLGHNGAGKTTTIAMLTGLIPPDSGTALIEGLDITRDMHLVRKKLGVCPQHDILYPDLTVEEHLRMFAAFKGTPSRLLQEEVDKIISSVGLVEKRHYFAKNLSGGQKRKLSVGIAFIGGSQVVFLDEPTSGMDPYSRRFTWNVIRQYREGRVIVLTTHFMDEADLLGDRIAIMGDGKLKCCGSSLFLKARYGVGYNLTFEKQFAQDFQSQGLMGLLEEKRIGAKLLTDVGTEISFQLPFSSSYAFQGLFDYLDLNMSTLGLQSYGISVTTMEEVFIKVTHGTHTQQTADLGRKHSMNNMETDAKEKKNAGDLESGSKSNRYTPVQFQRMNPNSNVVSFFFVHLYAMVTKRFLYFKRDTNTWIFQYILPVVFLLIGMVIMRFTVIYSKQPIKVLSPHQLYNTKISTNYFPLVYNNAHFFCKRDSSLTFAYNASNLTQVRRAQSSCDLTSHQDNIMTSLSDSSNFPLYSTPAHTIGEMSTIIFERMDDFESSQIGALSFSRVYHGFSPYDGWLNFNYDPNNPNPGQTKHYPANLSKHGVMSEIDVILHSNYTAIHSSPLFASLAANAVVQSLNPMSSLTYSLHPLPLTSKESKTFDSYNADTVVTFLLLGIAFVPAGFAMWVVREREVKAKQQQLVSGIGMGAYWFANWLWDNLSFQVSIWLIIILLTIFPKTGTLASRPGGELGITFGLLMLFGASGAGFAYIISFLFKTPAGTLVSVLFIHWLLGFMLGIVGQALRFIPTTTKVYRHALRYIFDIVPIFALADGLHSMTLIQSLSFNELKGGKLYHPLDWEIAGCPLLFLGVESVVYLLITIAIDYFSSIPSLQAYFSPPITIPPSDESVKDSDVKDEERRVEEMSVPSPLTSSSSTPPLPIYIKGLKKVYPGGKYALKGLSLAIPTGECFGLLGINGAGKSTALSILSGEFQPTEGQAYLAGLSILTNVHMCRGLIGFCPQFDALFELLTGREHLEMYARIKGIRIEDIPAVVDGKLADLGLTEYADRLAGTYSGGNKRKLSVAIAMIGEPPIVFLDEPSTGMDPVARRFMWEVISEIVTGRDPGSAPTGSGEGNMGSGGAGCCVILTTHSMEEAEALCTRIGIMVGGAMRCLGSSQRLKDRYGLGYQIEVRFHIPSNESVLSNLTQFCQRINKASLLSPTTAAESDGDKEEVQLSEQEMHQILDAMGKSDWKSELSSSGSGAELVATLQAHQSVGGRQFTQWYLLEESFQKLVVSLIVQLDVFVVRERQGTKVRLEVPAQGYGGEKRKLGSLFGAMEREKDPLGIAEYSVCQTSLEQIFNHFAGQQVEEHGHAAGIVGGGGGGGGSGSSSELKYVSPRYNAWQQTGILAPSSSSSDPPPISQIPSNQNLSSPTQPNSAI